MSEVYKEANWNYHNFHRINGANQFMNDEDNSMNHVLTENGSIYDVHYAVYNPDSDEFLKGDLRQAYNDAENNHNDDWLDAYQDASIEDDNTDMVVVGLFEDDADNIRFTDDCVQVNNKKGDLTFRFVDVNDVFPHVDAVAFNTEDKMPVVRQEPQQLDLNLEGLDNGDGLTK